MANKQQTNKAVTKQQTADRYRTSHVLCQAGHAATNTLAVFSAVWKEISNVWCRCKCRSDGTYCRIRQYLTWKKSRKKYHIDIIHKVLLSRYIRGFYLKKLRGKCCTVQAAFVGNRRESAADGKTGDSAVAVVCLRSSEVPLSSAKRMSLGRAAWRDVLSPDTCFDQGHSIQPSSSCCVLDLL